MHLNSLTVVYPDLKDHIFQFMRRLCRWNRCIFLVFFSPSCESGEAPASRCIINESFSGIISPSLPWKLCEEEPSINLVIFARPPLKKLPIHLVDLVFFVSQRRTYSLGQKKRQCKDASPVIWDYAKSVCLKRKSYRSCLKLYEKRKLNCANNLQKEHSSLHLVCPAVR